MNSIPSLLVCLLALTLSWKSAIAASATSSSLILTNGDTLFGNLQQVQSGVLAWIHPDADAPLEFPYTNVSEVLFTAQPALASSSLNCSVYLWSGDLLNCNLVSCGEQEIQVLTPYAGKLSIPRKAVRALLPRSAQKPPIFEGPNGLQEWTVGKINAVAAQGDSGEWRYKNGAFYATQSASIARKFDLPNIASIEFDLAWKGFFHLAVALYTEYLQPVSLASKESEPDFGGFYSLQLNSFYANLLPITKKDPLRYLGQAPLSVYSQKSYAHIGIRVNKIKHSIALLMDGVLVKEWIDPDGFVGTGNGLRFVNQAQGGALKLDHLRISEWDGQYEERLTNAPPSGHDLAQLRNGDRVTGKVETIQAGSMTIQGPELRLEIPLERVRQIEMDSARSIRATPVDPSRAYLVDGSILTFDLKSFDADGSMQIVSPVFGPAKIAPGALQRLTREF